MKGDLINFFLMFVLGFLVASLVIAILIYLDNSVDELGQAICEKEYGMDFQSYNDKELKCKPKIEKKIQYDGITVKLK